MEQILHNLLKGVFTEAIRGWNRSHQLGTYFTDGMVYSSLEGRISAQCPMASLSSKSQSRMEP